MLNVARRENMEKILRKAGAILITVLSICVAAVTFMKFVTIDISSGTSIMETILSWAGINKNISLTGNQIQINIKSVFGF